jgi:hypothetical protein
MQFLKCHGAGMELSGGTLQKACIRHCKNKIKNAVIVFN